MSPLKKRAKIEIGVTPSTGTILELTCETVDRVFDAIAKEPDKTDPWVAAATLHQRMLQKIRQQEDELKAFRAKRSKREKEALATQYERDHLQSQIEEYRSFPIPNLEQLAREECRKVDESLNNTKAAASRDEILLKFLRVDIYDPHQKQAVTLQLQKCFEQRAELGKKVQIKRQTLKKIQEELKTQQDFLSSLPMHIQTLERASQSLVKFMQKNVLIHPLSGNERLQRLQRAKSLPPPMYALFELLQHAIDDHPGVSIKISSNDQVVLQFPLPDLANAQKRRQNVSIIFIYGGGNQVYVETSGCSTIIHPENLLLQELFDGDTSATGSYGWANQLAGLHPVGVASVASTGLILREMERRIYAYAVLQYCLLELSRGKVPVPPGETQTALSKTSAKFTKPSLGNNTLVDGVYDVTIENVSFDVKVKIPGSQYPAKPPVWSIPLDKTLEHRLNVELLQEVSENDGPWILIYQVRSLLDSVGSDKVAIVRLRKGRNRKFA